MDELTKEAYRSYSSWIWAQIKLQTADLSKKENLSVPDLNLYIKEITRLARKFNQLERRLGASEDHFSFAPTENS